MKNIYARSLMETLFDKQEMKILETILDDQMNEEEKCKTLIEEIKDVRV